MPINCHKFILILFIISVIVFGVREIRGVGLIYLINCNHNYKIERCIGLETNSPITMIQDFYSHMIKETRNPSDVYKAFNMLSKNVQNQFITNENNSVDNNFIDFWELEAKKTEIIKASHEPRSKEISQIELYICHLRKKEWLEAHIGESERFCSHDIFELYHTGINKPYKWEITKFTSGSNECGEPYTEKCNNLEFEDRIGWSND